MTLSCKASSQQSKGLTPFSLPAVSISYLHSHLPCLWEEHAHSWSNSTAIAHSFSLVRSSPWSVGCTETSTCKQTSQGRVHMMMQCIKVLWNPSVVGGSGKHYALHREKGDKLDTLIAYFSCILFSIAEASPVFANCCRGRGETRFSRLFQFNRPKRIMQLLLKINKQKKNNLEINK